VGTSNLGIAVIFAASSSLFPVRWLFLLPLQQIVHVATAA
jgi:hypothetical protein